MKFPNLMYRCPGEHHRPGGTFSYMPVADSNQAKLAFHSGWYPTLPLAIEAPKKFKIEGFLSSEPVTAAAQERKEVSNKPPTRCELETKARELNISFTETTKSGTLQHKIEAILAED